MHIIILISLDKINKYYYLWRDREYTYRTLHVQVLFALFNNRERKVFRFPHALSAETKLISTL